MREISKGVNFHFFFVEGLHTYIHIVKGDEVEKYLVDLLTHIF